MTLARVDLENFDNEAGHEIHKSPDFLRGFEAGSEIAQQSSVVNLALSTEAISATLSDMKFGYAEARVQILERLRPLLSQVADAILPHIARECFTAHFVDVLMSDFDQTASQPVVISVHPDAATHLAAELSDHEGDFTFIPDETLAEGQAILTSECTHIMIDLPALILALQTALNGLEPPERNLSHG